jgi:phosphohistidine phosphatase SixA
MPKPLRKARLLVTAKNVSAALFALGLLAGPAIADAQEAVFVVRHAERADTSEDSLLSAAGQARAMRLAAILKDAGISRIFTTDRRRTVQTAAPVAAALTLTPIELPANDLDGLLAQLRSSAIRDRVLVVGHSNTVPEIVRRLGVAASVAIGDEYDNIFIVIPREGSTASLVRLRY